MVALLGKPELLNFTKEEINGSASFVALLSKLDVVIELDLVFMPCIPVFGTILSISLYLSLSLSLS